MGGLYSELAEALGRYATPWQLTVELWTMLVRTPRKGSWSRPAIARGDQPEASINA